MGKPKAKAKKTTKSKKSVAPRAAKRATGKDAPVDHLVFHAPPEPKVKKAKE